MSARDVTLIVLYLVYGGSFLLMATFLWTWLDKTARLGVASSLSLLATFAAIHGVADIVGAVSIIADINRGPTAPLGAARVVMLSVSFVVLLWLGLALLTDSEPLLRLLRAIFTFVVVAGSAAIAALYAGDATTALRMVEQAVRVFVGLPGGVLTAIGLWRVSRKCTILGLRECTSGSRIAAIGMAAYAAVSAVAIGSYPVPVAFTVPVLFLRTIFALVITTGCVWMLRSLRVAD